ncbi:MAG: AI-2E family transporter [Candidatus Magasanikbacteria bacterium]|nr:AI-2E family transporter [Candidatus Magasanikbacteria bacterium]
MDFSKMRNYLIFGLLILVTLAFLGILRPFAYPLFWAAVIASLFHPIFKKLDAFIKHANLSALITLALVILIIVLPLAIFSVLLVKESVSIYTSINTSGGEINATIMKVAETIKHNPLTARLSINEAFWNDKFAEATTFLVNYVFKNLRALTQNSLVFLAMFVLTLYSVFFFVRDGAKLIKKLMYLAPIGSRYEIMLFNKFTTAAGAIIKGTLVVGGVQGLLGSIVFSIAGIEGALIWGIIMMICSLIPTVGTAIIWLPAGILLILAGQIWQGILILLAGALVISTIDNFLRPMLVGKDLSLPPLVVLFSTLGGIAAFGLTGFMLGPIIAALFISFWDMYEEYYRAELEKN